MIDLFENNTPETLELRPMQEYVADQARQALGQHKRIVIQCATGFGKTILATYFFQRARERGNRCLFVCDRRTLVDQTSVVLDRFGVNHGIIMSDDPRYFPQAQVQIASIQTLARRKIRKFDFIIIDECHTFYKAHQDLLEANPQAFVIGLSATPFTKGLGKHFDAHIEPVPVKTMIAEGYLSKFEIWGPPGIDLDSVRTVAGEYHAGDLEKAADKVSLIGDIVSHWRKLAEGRKTIIFCAAVPHSKHMAKEFNRNGISAVHIDGYQLEEEKQAQIEAFIQGKAMVLCSVEIAIKGFDVPEVSCVIWATATKSHMKWIQGCGRGLRTSPEKENCIILDHGSNCARLGFPDEYEFLGLDDGNQKEKKQKAREREPPKPKSCDSCDYLKPAGVRECPACGFEPEYIKEVEVEDGELIRLARDRRKQATLLDKQKTLAALNGYALRKGYKCKNGVYGWALHTYSEMFGCKPASQMEWDAVGDMTDEAQKFIQHKNIRYAKGGRA